MLLEAKYHVITVTMIKIKPAFVCKFQSVINTRPLGHREISRVDFGCASVIARRVLCDRLACVRNHVIWKLDKSSLPDAHIHEVDHRALE